LNAIAQNTPVTAASVVAAVTLVLAEFTALTEGQISAVTAVVAIVAGFLVQKLGTEPKPGRYDEGDTGVTAARGVR
jgi:hypothetical protein